MIKEAMFYEKLGGNRVQCGLCSHRCKIDPGSFGVCGVRKNTGGRLDTLVYGEVIAAHVDPIEKKPIYHFLPGSYSYSIATVGCNFKCSFCQNWQISQASKMGEGWRVEGGGREMTPDEVVKEAKKADCRSISYTYTEPTIFFEYAYDTARLAKAAGLSNIFVTNGYMAGEALREISPYLDAANVDLKSFREDFYKEICTTHGYKNRLDMVDMLKDVGLGPCCGGIIGLGEGVEDRLKLLFRLKELGVKCVPINILNPRKGTLLEAIEPLSPWEIIKTIAVFRLVLQDAIIKVAGGRESGLRDMQAMAFMAGANGMIIGGYLTTKGRSVDQDLQMVKDLGFSLK